jgi:hypothetical protein
MGITMTPEQVRDYFVAVEERAKALTNGQMPTGKIPAGILLGVAEKLRWIELSSSLWNKSKTPGLMAPGERRTK